MFENMFICVKILLLLDIFVKYAQCEDMDVSEVCTVS
jgi:hypothetical protein